VVLLNENFIRIFHIFCSFDFPTLLSGRQGCRLCSGILENKEAMADEKNTFDRSDDSSEPYKGGQKNAYQAA